MPHYASESFSSSASDDEGLEDTCCYRCGRLGHWAHECYARTNVNGQSLRSNEFHAKKHKPTSRVVKACVYVLGDEAGQMYVGKSQDVEKRIEQHLAGEGTQFLVGKVRRLEVTEAGSEADLESWERNETLARMYKHGVDKVRGWMFTSVSLSAELKEQAFGQICEKYDLCRQCGRNTHFADKCFARSKAFWAGESGCGGARMRV